MLHDPSGTPQAAPPLVSGPAATLLGRSVTFPLPFRYRSVIFLSPGRITKESRTRRQPLSFPFSTITGVGSAPRAPLRHPHQAAPPGGNAFRCGRRPVGRAVGPGQLARYASPLCSEGVKSQKAGAPKDPGSDPPEASVYVAEDEDLFLHIPVHGVRVVEKVPQDLGVVGRGHD